MSHTSIDGISDKYLCGYVSYEPHNSCCHVFYKCYSKLPGTLRSLKGPYRIVSDFKNVRQNNLISLLYDRTSPGNFDPHILFDQKHVCCCKSRLRIGFDILFNFNEI